MKLKKLFALALAVCMMVSVMPTSFAGNGFLSLDGVQPAATTSGPSLTLDTPGTVSGGSVTTPSVSQSSQSVYTPYVYSNPYGVSSVADEGDGEEETTPAAPKATNTEVLSEGGSGYEAPSLDGNPYTLSNTIASVGAANDNTTVKVANNKVTLTKNISGPDANGHYTITLGASTESETVTVKSAANIVLVLDASQSMVDDADTLNAAVDKFLLGASSSKDSKVAIISYSNEAVARTNNTADGTAFLPISVNDSLNSALTTAVDDVTSATKATAGTSNVAKLADKGLEKAVDVIHAYNAVYKNDETPVIVVLFTDGVPTQDTTAKSNIWAKQYDAYGIAQDALHWSTILKGTKGNAVLTESTHRNQEFYTPESIFSNDHWSRTSDEVWETMTNEKTNVGCGATVYTVGINLPNYSYGGDGAKINEFMYRASSHVPTSAHEDAGYSYYAYDNSTRNKGYYLVGEMTTDLFKDVQMEGGVSLKNVTLRDVVPDYMEIVGSAENTVEWTNQSVTPGANGALTKTLTVRFKDGFLGGHSVPTNDAASGLYAVDAATGAETLVGAFGIPTVNVPIPDITVTAVDKNIYLGKDLTDAELLKGVKATYDVVTKDNDGKEITKTFTIDPTQPNFGLKNWQTAYTKSIEFYVVEDAPTDTLGCTITPNDSQAAVYPAVTKTDDVNITVFKPHITFNDSTIYLGNWANYADDPNDSYVAWCNGNTLSTDVSMIGDEPSVTVKYNQATGYFDGCEDISVETVKLNNSGNYAADTIFWNGETKTNNSHQFTVHVVKPTFTPSNTTIYLSNEIDLNTLMQEHDDWSCEHTSLSADEAPYAPDHSFRVNETAVADKLAPEDCATYSVSTTVNGLTAQTGTEVTVHVVKPEFSYADTSVYLGNSVNLNALVSEVGETWACDETGDDKAYLDIFDKETRARIAPQIDHSFSTGADEDAYLPDNCTLVTFTTTVTTEYQTGNVSKSATPAEPAFTVHVYVPQFTVTTQDLWADCGSEVPLYDTTKAVDAIVDIAYPANKWVDRKADYNTAPKAGAQDIKDIDVQFSITDPIESMGETDVNVNVIKLSSTVNGATYEVTPGTDVKTDANLTVIKAVPDEDHDFTVHVNKFKAVITNNGTQNAIYTLSNGTKVAVEAGKSTTVAGLICGKDYEISEANNDWTWRYGEAASAKDGDGNEKAYISCKVNEVKASATPESSDRVFMTYGNITNPKWLADEDCVVNNAATPNCTIPVKKEDDEEVTNV